jgi:hypothetical protein
MSTNMLDTAMSCPPVVDDVHDEYHLWYCHSRFTSNPNGELGRRSSAPSCAVR